jgi:DNA helicase IV
VQGLKNVLLTTRSDRPHYTMAVLCPTGKRATELEAKLHEEMWSNNILTRVSDNDDAATLCDAYHMHFTTLLQSKGLEFDAVFVVDVDAYNLSLATDLAALYVALSRAGRRLGVTSRAAVPGKLSEVFSRHLTDYEEQIPRPGSVEGPS